MTGRLASAGAAFASDKAVRVEHPSDPDSWFWRESGSRDLLLHRDGFVHRNAVDTDDVERIANHDDNDYETVPVEESPFDR